MNHFAHWTEADVHAHNARVRRENRIDFATVVQPAERHCEADLHSQILDYCKRRGWIALHGIMARATARTPGEWDFIILADKGRVLLVECKTKTGKLSPEQFALHHWAKNLGHEPHIVRSLVEFYGVVGK